MAFWNWPEAIGCWQIELKEQDVVLRAEEKKTTALLEKATVWFKREGISRDFMRFLQQMTRGGGCVKRFGR